MCSDVEQKGLGLQGLSHDWAQPGGFVSEKPQPLLRLTRDVKGRREPSWEVDTEDYIKEHFLSSLWQLGNSRSGLQLASVKGTGMNGVYVHVPNFHNDLPLLLLLFFHLPFLPLPSPPPPSPLPSIPLLLLPLFPPPLSPSSAFCLHLSFNFQLPIVELCICLLLRSCFNS